MALVRLDIEEAKDQLPLVCMCCGEEATVTRKRKMSYTPPWVIVTIIGGLLPYLIVASILTKRTTIQGPFCERHRYHWLARSLAMGMSFLCLLPLLVGAFALIPMSEGRRGGWAASLIGPAWITVVGLLVAWIILVIIMRSTGIRPSEITETEVVLKGVDDRFVEAIERHDEERRERRKRARRARLDRYEESGDEVDRPRRSREDSMHFEDRRRRSSRYDDED